VGDRLDATLEAQGATAIRLCGPLVVEIAGRRVEAGLPSRQGRMVFAYLLLSRRRPVSRDELAEALWPDRAPAAVQTLLTELLSRVRSALPAGVLQGRAQLSLELPADAWVDVEAAAALAARARERLSAGEPAAVLAITREALDLIGAPLLPDIDRIWADEARRALEEVAASLLELFARAGLLAGGDELGLAEAAARELIAREPFRESAYGLLMEVHAARGDVARALTVFEELRTLLRDELGTVPAASVRALNDRLLTADAPSRAPAELPAALRACRVFVGRGAELARVTDVLGSGNGRPRLLLLTGEPGVGKTSLAVRAARELHAGGAAVLYGRSDPEPLAPYQPFAEALGDLTERAPALLDGVATSALARIVPRLGGAAEEDDPQVDRHRLFEAATALVGAAAPGGRVLLVLDDVHWADQPTLLMLSYVLRHGSPALVVLGTTRPFEESRSALGELVVDLRRDGQVERLSLDGLDPGATHELVAARSRVAPHPEFVHWIHARTDGNPFYVEATLRDLQPDLISAPAPGALERTPVPQGVRDLVAQRLARLDEDAAEALRVGAALGPVFQLAHVEPLLGGHARALAALDEAVASGLVRETRAGAYAFVHAIAREAIYDGMTAARRASLHLRVGEALEERRAPAQALAHHFHEARHLAGHEKPVRHHVAAAEASARALAYEDQIGHYDLALAVLDEAGPGTDDEARCRILLAVAEREVNLGADFRSRVRLAAEIAERHGWADVLAEAAVAHGRVAEYGRVDRATIDLLERALALLGDEDGPAKARVLGRLAEAMYYDGEAPERRHELSRRALEMARRAAQTGHDRGVLRDGEVLIGVLSSRGRALAGPDNIEEQLALADEALELAPRLADPQWPLGAHAARAVLHRYRGQLAAARGDIDALETLVDELRLRETYWDAELQRARAGEALLAGDLEEAERRARHSGAILARIGDPDAEHLLVALLLAIRLRQGRADELAAAIAERAARPDAPPAWAALLGLIHLRAGRGNDARRQLLAFAGDGFGAIPVDEDWLGTLAVLAEICASVGEPRLAATLERLLRPYANRHPLLVIQSIPTIPVAQALALLRSTMSSDEPLSSTS
jgi:DNA-binding SARP family transcriptional activator